MLEFSAKSDQQLAGVSTDAEICEGVMDSVPLLLDTEALQSFHSLLYRSSVCGIAYLVSYGHHSEANIASESAARPKLTNINDFPFREAALAMKS